nr:immunoglobulin heavy chain junction region [Macaca mulatta]
CARRSAGIYGLDSW